MSILWLFTGIAVVILSFTCASITIRSDDSRTPLYVVTLITATIYMIYSLSHLAFACSNGYSKWEHVMRFIKQDHVTVFEEDNKVTKVVIKPGDNVVIEDDGTIIVYPNEAESEG